MLHLCPPSTLKETPKCIMEYRAVTLRCDGKCNGLLDKAVKELSCSLEPIEAEAHTLVCCFARYLKEDVPVL